MSEGVRVCLSVRLLREGERGKERVCAMTDRIHSLTSPSPRLVCVCLFRSLVARRSSPSQEACTGASTHWYTPARNHHECEERLFGCRETVDTEDIVGDFSEINQLTIKALSLAVSRSPTSLSLSLSLSERVCVSE